MSSYKLERRRLLARQLATLMSINPDVIVIDGDFISVFFIDSDVRATNRHAHNTDGPIDEEAYRRGFQQGFEATVEAFKAGITPRRIERWRWAIYLWRFERTHKKRTFPPRHQKMKAPRDRW